MTRHFKKIHQIFARLTWYSIFGELDFFASRVKKLQKYADIAKRFSLGESAVKTMLFRIRQELKSYLRKEGLIP